LIEARTGAPGGTPSTRVGRRIRQCVDLRAVLPGRPEHRLGTRASREALSATRPTAEGRFARCAVVGIGRAGWLVAQQGWRPCTIPRALLVNSMAGGIRIARPEDESSGLGPIAGRACASRLYEDSTSECPASLRPANGVKSTFKAYRRARAERRRFADGSDALGQYQNGGVHAGHALHWLAAHYRMVKANTRTRCSARWWIDRLAAIFRTAFGGRRAKGSNGRPGTENQAARTVIWPDNFRFLAKPFSYANRHLGRATIDRSTRLRQRGNNATVCNAGGWPR